MLLFLFIVSSIASNYLEPESHIIETNEDNITLGTFDSDKCNIIDLDIIVHCSNANVLFPISYLLIQTNSTKEFPWHKEYNGTNTQFYRYTHTVGVINGTTNIILFKGSGCNGPLEIIIKKLKVYETNCDSNTFGLTIAKIGGLMLLGVMCYVFLFGCC